MTEYLIMSMVSLNRVTKIVETVQSLITAAMANTTWQKQGSEASVLH
ncbi:hypothetical protein [Vibrio mediterranei]|nr:hypothetical protein [Vibrio mediterranei]